MARFVQVERSGDLSAQVALAHERLFSRTALADEIATGVDFLKSSQIEGVTLDAAWRQYAQALLASNELQFVD